ncbi:sulfite exporter TauE/SafE family protein 3-like isoform X2 [Henckelia pumila]|uniref:sulfite exporter TauE/SafE family protein 3-like isoform X2 n=1 Tax=Henckelia pumila TaxID=405737 RepID=UPI003C6E6C9A
MAVVGGESKNPLKGIALIVIGVIVLACGVVSADEGLKRGIARNDGSMENSESGYLTKTITLFLRNVETLFQHVWPNMEFGWRIVVGTVIGFFGAALGSVGGVGGGGIFVPMFILIIGFDPKSSTALSKCMIMGAAISTVYYNLKLRHPTLDLPLIDYDAALLFQPMLVLGISIGVFFNVIFAEWMVTILLIILFVGTSTKAFFKGIETWKKESIIKVVAWNFASSNDGVPYERLPEGPTTEIRMRVNEFKPLEVSTINNVCWKEISILFLAWFIILLLHIAKDLTATCSVAYWMVTLLQIPVAVVVSGYEAVCLYKGWRVMGSKEDTGNTWTISQLIFCCFCGVLAGIVGGLLGLGGGFILGPLLLELGIPPQVSSATASFAMAFSSSMSVIQYYLLRRFPTSYALYFIAVAMVAALVGQHVVRKMISLFGRASVIIFILAFTIFVSAISLGGVGISNIIGKVEGKESMWFYNICESEP